MRIGFDNDKYLKIQSEHIKERISQFGDKLYLEFGGKLFDDYHASRVLPGFAPDSKLQMLMQLSDVAELGLVISAADRLWLLPRRGLEAEKWQPVFHSFIMKTFAEPKPAMRSSRHSQSGIFR